MSAPLIIRLIVQQVCRAPGNANVWRSVASGAEAGRSAACATMLRSSATIDGCQQVGVQTLLSIVVPKKHARQHERCAQRTHAAQRRF